MTRKLNTQHNVEVMIQEGTPYSTAGPSSIYPHDLFMKAKHLENMPRLLMCDSLSASNGDNVCAY